MPRGPLALSEGGTIREAGLCRGPGPGPPSEGAVSLCPPRHGLCIGSGGGKLNSIPFNSGKSSRRRSGQTGRLISTCRLIRPQAGRRRLISTCRLISHIEQAGPPAHLHDALWRLGTGLPVAGLGGGLMPSRCCTSRICPMRSARLEPTWRPTSLPPLPRCTHERGVRVWVLGACRGLDRPPCPPCRSAEGGQGVGEGLGACRGRGRAGRTRADKWAGGGQDRAGQGGVPDRLM